MSKMLLVGMILLICGFLANAVVIEVNGGMPVPRISTIYDRWIKDGDKEVVGYVSLTKDTRLPFLSDIIGNDSLGYYSIGDLMMLSGGAFVGIKLFYSVRRLRETWRYTVGVVS